VDDTKLYSTAEVGEKLGVSRVTVWRWIAAGHLRAIDLSVGPDGEVFAGRKARLRIREPDLQQFIDDLALNASA
jgi:excisionase family DNA binding protein